jgi:hypothetical protein
MERPQTPRDKGLVPSSVLLEGGGTFKRWNLVRGFRCLEDGSSREIMGA